MDSDEKFDETSEKDGKMADENKRLFKSVQKSYRDWQPFRQVTHRLVSEYAGEGYGSNKDRKKELIVNLLNQTVGAYMMALAANRPRVLATARRRRFQGFAKHFQLALNNLIKDIGYEHTLRRWVMDAFFSVGIVKTHMAESALVELEKDIYADPGRPFASNVSIDNFVVASARKWSEVEYIGDVYQLPREDLEDGDVWNQEAVKEVRPGGRGTSGDERQENIGSDRSVEVEELRPMVDLVDLYFPHDRKIVTYACDFGDGTLKPYGRPLAEMKWKGGELGPYHILSFEEVPENLMPVGPATHLSSLARHINNIYRKQVSSARQFKEVYAYTPAGEQSARNLVNANHGESVCVTDPNEVTTVKLNGVDQQNQMFLLNMLDHFNTMAGNVSALAGLSPQADTLGQERLIHGAVSGRVAQMGDRVTSAVVSCLKDLAQLMWDDEVNSIPGELEIEGLPGYSAESNWEPGDREGDISDYDICIDVHSLPHKSPSERAQSILELISSVYVPLSDHLMMQGGTIDMQTLNNTLVELLDLPRLKDIVRFNAPATPETPETMGPRAGGKPANTTREYVRRSAGNNDQGRNTSQQQAWAALNSTGGGRQ